MHLCTATMPALSKIRHAAKGGTLTTPPAHCVSMCSGTRHSQQDHVTPSCHTYSPQLRQYVGSGCCTSQVAALRSVKVRGHHCRMQPVAAKHCTQLVTITGGPASQSVTKHLDPPPGLHAYCLACLCTAATHTVHTPHQHPTETRARPDWPCAHHTDIHRPPSNTVALHHSALPCTQADQTTPLTPPAGGSC